MAERSKALRSGRSPLLWAWVRIPLLTNVFVQIKCLLLIHNKQTLLANALNCTALNVNVPLNV